MSSPSDRAHFARLGAAKAASHAAAQLDHSRLTVAERLVRSVALTEAFLASANLDARHDDPSAFYARARVLGLYRP